MHAANLADEGDKGGAARKVKIKHLEGQLAMASWPPRPKQSRRGHAAEGVRKQAGR